MAVNESRNMHAELVQGVMDGSYIDSTPDRGGQVEGTEEGERRNWPTYARADEIPALKRVITG